MTANLITCIVERGNADKIVDAAIKAGAQAATYYYARGRGLREKLGIFGKLIQPEKEIVFIVTKKDQTQSIFDVVSETAELAQHGKGIAFIQPIEQVNGLY